MRGVTALVTIVFAAAVAGQNLEFSTVQQASIEEFPYVAALLRSTDLTNFAQRCGGAILNNRAVVTAARCFGSDPPNRWRFRVGSTKHNSGGTVYPVTDIFLYDFDEWSMGWDLAVVHTRTTIIQSDVVKPGSFAGSNYILGDNQAVTAVGWGLTSMPLWNPAQFEDLRKHQQAIVNTEECRVPYSAEGFYIQPFQICSSFVSFGQASASNADDKCLGDPGTPLVHDGVVVGIRSYALGCNNLEIPTVSTRVSSFIDWISENA